MLGRYYSCLSSLAGIGSLLPTTLPTYRTSVQANTLSTNSQRNAKSPKSIEFDNKMVTLIQPLHASFNTVQSRNMHETWELSLSQAAYLVG